MSQPPGSTHSCRVCKNSEGHTVYHPREMMYGTREVFEYFQCSQCGCLQIAEMPEDMSPYYPGDYYSFFKYDGKKFKGLLGRIKKIQYKQSVIGSGFAKWLFGKKEYRILNGYRVTTASRILDVGCGNGKNFLYPLAEVGFEQVMGCDPYLAEPMEYDNGLKILKSDVFDITGQWDVITYHHAFEHLPNPLENLQQVEKLLSDQGVCVLRIPTASSFAWEHYGGDWVQLDAPRHFFVHSKESVAQLAEQAGLILEKVIYDSTHFQFTGSEKYRKDIPLNTPKDKRLGPKLKRKWDEWRYQRRAQRLNREQQGDQAAFFLRKK